MAVNLDGVLGAWTVGLLLQFFFSRCLLFLSLSQKTKGTVKQTDKSCTGVFGVALRKKGENRCRTGTLSIGGGSEQDLKISNII